MEKSNFKKPIDRLAQIAARIALRTALTKSAIDSPKPRKLQESIAPEKRQNALKSAQNGDVLIINHRQFEGGES